jgi:peptidoglycan/LPS O-acetylase OafA/YrhL
MTPVTRLYDRVSRPAALAVAALGAVSATVLATADPPDLQDASPGLVQGAVVAVLVVGGVLLPLLALLAVRGRPQRRLAPVVAAAVALLAHAVSMSGLVREPVQAVSSSLAMALCFLLAVVGLVAGMDEHERRPARSSFSR